MSIEPEYTLSISLETLRHLGIGLYSNIPAVLSETVANAYDADATRVTIDIDAENKVIIITDNGWGMSKDDINSKYLRVGYDKRRQETLLKEGLTPKGRKPMGRKGIGKLALFSIADTAEVQSAKHLENNTVEKAGFVMSVEAIQKCIEAQTPYHPTPVANVLVERGTRIELSDLRLSTETTAAFLRRRLARRFSVIGPDTGFDVQIDGKSIDTEDREYFRDVEFLWYFGEGSERYAKWATNSTHQVAKDGVVDAELGYKVSGWIGTVVEQKALREGDNSIVVLARGKLMHEDLLTNLKEAGVYAQYLIGEVRADFLDLDDNVDMATSNRQSIREDDPRFFKLKTYVQSAILKDIQNKWSDFRKKEAETKALSDAAVKEWFDGLFPDNQKWARSLFEKIESFPVRDPEFKKELYKNGILAFETLAQKKNLALLDDISTDQDVEAFQRILLSIDELEQVHYYEIVKGRVGVLKKFSELASPNIKEKVIHQHIFDHLWLLDTTWERAGTNERMEQSLGREFDTISASLLQEERDARLDIRYRTAAGKHIIIELKRYDRSVGIDELSQQVRKYRDALRKCLSLSHTGEENNIEIICLLGSPPVPDAERVRNIEQLKANNARFITYDDLIARTQKSYDDYLMADKKVSRIMVLVDSIGKTRIQS